MKRKFHIVLWLFLLCGGIGLKGWSQQDPMFSQYMLTGHYLNPGYAGHGKWMQMNFLHRSQWLKGRGAPTTQVFSGEGPAKNSGLGLGWIVLNDHIGVTNRVSLSGDLAFHLGNPKGMRYSLGLRLGGSWYRSDFTQLTYWDQNDVVYADGVNNTVLPNLGAGFFMHTDRFYAGFSVPQIISYDPAQNFSVQAEGKPLPQLRRHYYLTSGLVVKLSEDVQLKPSFLLKYVEGAPLEADLNLSVFLRNLVEVGATYRTGDGFLGMVMVRLGPQVRLGYAFDYSLTAMRMFTVGSHEIFLSLDLGKERQKFKSPRYF
ncbi:MAG: type IX secretion system membrane protein PorP/SprF [Bacteroidia bacterium]|nr:type IX secretion system membrane protein PorP/SprF [Bacteroidia bacterium]